jgi:hypothetical protein
MPYVIIPDVHERVEKLSRIVSDMKGAGQLVFLGDFLDSFHPGGFQDTLDTIDDLLETDALFCLGNHDIHYLYESRRLWCSGFRLGKKARLYQMAHLKKRWRERAAIYHDLGDWTVSHAGFHPSIVAEVERGAGLREECERALETADHYADHVLLQAGFKRGGFHPVGGPLWLDWSDFEPIEGMSQIVGHTPQGPEATGGQPDCSDPRNICLDTHLHHIALVTGPTIEIIPCPD